MFRLKILFISLFLTVLSVQAEVENFEFSTATSGTALPIVLQLSTTISSDNLEPPTVDIKANLEENHATANIIEVFNDKMGPQMAKQKEEEAQPEEEVQNEAEPAQEEIKPEENEVKEEEKVETEPAAEEDMVPEEPKEEDNPVEAEEPNKETAADAATEERDETASETEAEIPNETAAPVPDAEPELQPEVQTQATAGNADSEMSNDEPSKDDESHTDETTIGVGTDKNNTNDISCYICSSNDDLKCHKNPTQKAPCPKGSAGSNEKKHGCYTLYATDTNITMRGCVDELAEEGLKYCLTNEKFCELCYKTGCNNKTAPNLGNITQFNTFSLLLTVVIWMVFSKMWM